MAKKLVINFTNRWFYTLMIFVGVLMVAVSVYALGAVPNPGHSVAELQKCDSDGQILKMSAGSWVCGTDNTGVGGGWSGYEVVFASISAPGGRADCPAGKKVIGGGCDGTATSSQKVVASTPFSDVGWSCDFGVGSSGAASAYAICANVT